MGTLVEQAAAFLAGDGRKVVPGYLRAQGLQKHLHDDVVQEVLIGVLAFERKGTELEKPLDALVKAIARRKTIDIVRGKVRRPEAAIPVVWSDDGETSEPIDPVDEGTQPDDEVITAEELARLGGIVDDMRRRLAHRLAKHPSRAASALAVLAIVHGDASPADDCPAPQGGVAQSAAITWAGLFYGGADGCFPTDDGPEDAATRQRRSRALRHLRDVLQAAAADLGAILGGDDA
jgi:DNA-directed RNA polymerase specialized sigma24 family protein